MPSLVSFVHNILITSLINNNNTSSLKKGSSLDWETLKILL